MDYIRELKAGKFIRVEKPGYTPTVFWLSNWNDDLNYYNTAFGGAFKHSNTLDQISTHFKNMLSDGFNIVVFDINTAK